MSETALLAAGLAFLMPLGYALIALGGLAEDRARQVALSMLAALGLATLGYLAVGFALQFGGVGLVKNQPGYEGLIWEWSALGTTWGTGWGMLGLTGWGLGGAAANSAAYGLALANLPWVATTALIPLASLRGRIPAFATGLLGLLVGAVIYPLAGNWIWGGGWLANLGLNLSQGHGLVDPGGSGLVHLLGGSLALAGILVFVPRGPHPRPGEPVPLPPVHLPLLAVLGAGLLLAGQPAWWIANPLLDRRVIDLTQVALNGFVGAAAGGLLPLCYSWFVAGKPDPLMAARGVAAGSIALASAAPFVAPWAALAIGAAAGLLIPFVLFLVDHVLCFDDPTAACTVHGLSGALGLLAVALFADGRAGLGWNGVGSATYLGVAHQGVTGLFAASSFQPDWPAQFHAQVVGIAALVLFGFFASWVVLAPPATLLHLATRVPAGPKLPAGAAQGPSGADALAAVAEEEPAASRADPPADDAGAEPVPAPGA
jgi:Amt family ammonium transporter